MANSNRRNRAAQTRAQLCMQVRYLIAIAHPDGALQRHLDVLTGPERLVDSCVDEVAGEIVQALFDGGWLPSDLYEIARRRLEGRDVSYVLDVVAAVTARYPAPTVDARWREQVSQVGAGCWWRRDAPHLGQWAARHGHSRGVALTCALRALGALRALPRLAELLPPPGRACAESHLEHAAVDARMLAKVRALLAKAESSEFDDEAQALSAKAQQLMSRYSLHAAVAEAERGCVRSTTARRIWLEAPYVNAKSLLVQAVAEANRCTSVLAGSLGCATLVGDDRDLQFVELLTTSLLVQAGRAMAAAGSQSTGSGRSRTRSFRHSFLVAYAGRIGERLHAAAGAVQQQEDSARLLPVLAAREKAVEQTMAQLFPSLQYRRVSVSNAAGWGAGRAAADQARLDVRETLAG